MAALAWVLNAPAYHRLARFGETIVIPFLLLGATRMIAGAGRFRRRLSGGGWPCSSSRDTASNGEQRRATATHRDPRLGTFSPCVPGDVAPRTRQDSPLPDLCCSTFCAHRSAWPLQGAMRRLFVDEFENSKVALGLAVALTFVRATPFRSASRRLGRSECARFT